MPSNLDKYKKDLERIDNKGNRLLLAMEYECYPEQVLDAFKEELGAKTKKFFEDLPKFKEDYQAWYSEVKALIRQLLPDRLDDLIRLYEKPKSRRQISYENYRIEDYLQGLRVTSGGYEKRVIVDSSAAIPHFQQQLAILKAAAGRFESTLFDIRTACPSRPL